MAASKSKPISKPKSANVANTPDSESNTIPVDTVLPCNHLYRALDSTFRQKNKRNLTIYQRTDLFFCQRCLAQTEVKKIEELKGDADMIPDWFDAKRNYVITDLR